MSWNYWPLKFPDKSTADSLVIASSGNFDWDEIGTIPGATGWHVNIAVVGTVPTSLQPYVIPFPLFPKRVWFSNETGGVI